jgi:hypothetical protein
LNKYLVLIISNKLVYSYLYIILLSGYVHCDIDSQFVYFNELLISVDSKQVFLNSRFYRRH